MHCDVRLKEGEPTILKFFNENKIFHFHFSPRSQGFLLTICRYVFPVPKNKVMNGRQRDNKDIECRFNINAHVSRDIFVHNIAIKRYCNIWLFLATDF